MPDLRKWIDPSQLMLGGSASVTLVVSGTCPGLEQPIDIVLLADESNSMTLAERGSIFKTPTTVSTKSTPPEPPGTPDPGATPEPPPLPTDPGGNVPTPGGRATGGEPPFCNPSRRGNSTEPTEPPRPVPPTATRGVPSPEPPVPPMPLQGPGVTPEPPPLPTPPGPIEPPGPIVPPGPITTPRATEDINDLEPAGSVDQIREVKSWIRDFLGQEAVQNDLASGALRVGFVSFSDRARIRQPVTNQASKVLGAANRLRGGNVTRIEQGLREAERQLTDARKRDGADRAQVIIVLSDFQFCNRDVRPGARRSGVQIVTVGFGVRAYDRRKMYDIASKKEFVLTPRDMKRVVEIYGQELRKSRPVSVAQLTVRDQLTDTMKLVVGSASPPTVTITGQLLEWQFAPPTLPITLGYSVQPQAEGVWPVSVLAQALWTDSEALPGVADFPRAIVEVMMPTPTPTMTPTETPTPTATFTPTVTPTPTPAAMYLPILFKNWPPPLPTPTPAPTKCKPSEQTVDIVEVIDTSTSMSQPTSGGGVPKLQAAIAAAKELVYLLKPADQAAIVGFNSGAHLETGLTSDRARINAALDRLPATQAVGTRIDLGLDEAHRELIGPNHVSQNNRSIVLVTDGRQIGPPGSEAVTAAADRAKADGIKLITVGLGTDVDEDLLRSIASSPDLYFPAPNAEELLEIYRKIALVIPCP